VAHDHPRNRASRGGGLGGDPPPVCREQVDQPAEERAGFGGVLGFRGRAPGAARAVYAAGHAPHALQWPQVPP